MDSDIIRTLNHAGTGKFISVNGARRFLENIFGAMKDEITLPFVVGQHDKPENWLVHYISPLRNTDRLTVENFIEGLRNLEKSVITSEFNSSFIYHPIPDVTGSRAGSLLFSMSLQESDHNKEYNIIPSFRLSCFFGSQYIHGIEDKIEGFTAESEVVMTRLQLECQRFVGPNRSG